ncbi:hypothetical protein MN210_11390 [Psychrobacter raelei]|uniref:Uncharacterized protein n=1 Tax=Psychrobacter raelei TaxID=2565531 RepID=A0AAT9PDU9_9GAMM|nr:hypothetical protein [Psychrobacter sp. PraFG1]UNK04790.1 hypothetical protein MN210_11390 [Psychrobacter sp. PraFG1]
MSINESVTVKLPQDVQVENDAIEAAKESTVSTEDEQVGAVDKTGATSDKGALEVGTYGGNKNLPEIDGPQQASQETDDVYEDTRKMNSGLPPAGKNVGDLNAFDLGRHDND